MQFFVGLLMARTRYVDRDGSGIGVDDGLVYFDQLTPEDCPRVSFILSRQPLNVEQ